MVYFCQFIAQLFEVLTCVKNQFVNDAWYFLGIETYNYIFPMCIVLYIDCVETKGFCKWLW